MIDIKKYISQMGYSDGSPFREEEKLDIHTPNGIIDMTDTGIPLLANGRVLPPYSGKHQFNERVVTETPLPMAQYAPNLDAVEDSVYNMYPALRNLGNIPIVPDTSFNQRNTGVGDIEFFQETSDKITYPNGYVYNNPNIGGQSVVYNPKTNDAQNIALDMLHGLYKKDEKYKGLRKNLASAYFDKHNEDFKHEWERKLQEEGEGDGIEQFKDNHIDGIIRNLLFKGTSEDFKKNRYWEDAQEVYLSDPNIKKSFGELKTYLEKKHAGGEPGHIHPGEYEIKEDYDAETPLLDTGLGTYQGQQKRDEAVQVQKDWVESKEYKKRLKNQGYTKPKETQKQRLQALNNLYIHPNEEAFSGAGMFRGYPASFNPSIQLRQENSLPHELGHIAGGISPNEGDINMASHHKLYDKDGKIINYSWDDFKLNDADSDLLQESNLLWQNTPSSGGFKFTDDEHDFEPSEQYADFNGLRHTRLKELNKGFGEEFTQEDLNELKKRGYFTDRPFHETQAAYWKVGSTNKNFTGDRLKSKYKDKDMLHILNTVAEEANEDENKMPTAKHGGPLTNLPTGIDPSFYEHATDPKTWENLAIPFKNYKKAVSSLIPGSLKDFYNYSTDPVNLKRAAIPFRDYGRFITGQDEVREDVDEDTLEYYQWKYGGALPKAQTNAIDWDTPVTPQINYARPDGTRVSGLGDDYAGEYQDPGKSSTIHDVLNQTSMLPIVGEASDAANALLYAKKGDYENAAYSTAGLALPFFGGAAVKAGVKGLKNWWKGADKIVGQAPINNADNLIQPIPTVRNTGDYHYGSAFHDEKNLPDWNWGQSSDEFKQRMLKGLTKEGKRLDEFSGFDVNLHPYASQSHRARILAEIIDPITGRPISSIPHWSSTGSGGKDFPMGDWAPFPGHTKGGWFIKGTGYDTGYGSESLSVIGKDIDRRLFNQTGLTKFDLGFKHYDKELEEFYDPFRQGPRLDKSGNYETDINAMQKLRDIMNETTMGSRGRNIANKDVLGYNVNDLMKKYGIRRGGELPKAQTGYGDWGAYSVNFDKDLHQDTYNDWFSKTAKRLGTTPKVSREDGIIKDLFILDGNKDDSYYGPWGRDGNLSEHISIMGTGQGRKYLRNEMGDLRKERRWLTKKQRELERLKTIQYPEGLSSSQSTIPGILEQTASEIQGIKDLRRNWKDRGQYLGDNRAGRFGKNKWQEGQFDYVSPEQMDEFLSARRDRYMNDEDPDGRRKTYSDRKQFGGPLPKAQAGISDSTSTQRVDVRMQKLIAARLAFANKSNIVEETVEPVVDTTETIIDTTSNNVVDTTGQNISDSTVQSIVPNYNDNAYPWFNSNIEFPPIQDTIPQDTIPKAKTVEPVVKPTYPPEAFEDISNKETVYPPEAFEDVPKQEPWYSGIADYFAGNQGLIPGDQSDWNYLHGNEGILPGDQSDWNYLHGNEGLLPGDQSSWDFVHGREGYIPGDQSDIKDYIEGNQGIIPGDQTDLKKNAIDWIGQNISDDVGNVLRNPATDLGDNLELFKNFVHKKTSTGPYSEEAVEAMKVKKYEAEQQEIAEDAAEDERIRIEEENRQKGLIYLDKPQFSNTRKNKKLGNLEIKSSVIDLGTSAGRSGVSFGLGHNYKIDGTKPSYYEGQPNIDIQNAEGIVGSFHNKFVPYSHTSNKLFDVPVQLAWNQETGVFTAKKTEDLLDTDLVVPYGTSGDVGNVTKISDLDIKKLPDGSFDITTGGEDGMDFTNGTSTIKRKDGLNHFHIGIDDGAYKGGDFTSGKGKERVINSKDLNQYRSLRGGMVVLFDNDAEVSVMVTGSPNEIFSVLNDLQTKHPNKEWNMAKGDTGTYATSAYNPEGDDTTDVADMKTYSNQNTYGRNQYLVLLKQVIQSGQADSIPEAEAIVNSQIGKKPGTEELLPAQKYGGKLPIAQSGIKDYFPSWANPFNWGATDYTEEGDFDAAFRKARSEGDKEFMWNDTRYNSKISPVVKTDETGAVIKGLTDDILRRQQYKESLFDPNALNAGSGAKGLAQITDKVRTDAIKAKIITEEDDLFDPTTSRKVQKWYMDNLYNSSFIDKPNQSDSVRIAKTLAGYNWGRGNLSNLLNAQKKAGVDIYNSFDWLKELPVETSDYIQKILLRQVPAFEEEYDEAISIEKEGGELKKKLTIYRKYIDGDYYGTNEEKGAEEIYDKLNRKYLAPARKAKMNVANYIMSKVIE